VSTIKLVCGILLSVLALCAPLPVGAAEQTTAKERATVTKSGKANEQAPAQAHTLSIPVFFITDRNREDCKGKAEPMPKFGRLRQYHGLCSHDPFVGVAQVAIDNHAHKALDEHRAKIGWKAVHKIAEGPQSASLIEGCTYPEAKQRFYDELYKQAVSTPDREVFVFAPGYMSSFESGLKEAARFAYYAERPVLLYSWPSKGKFRDYASDTASVEWSQEHYNEMVDELSAMTKKDPAVSVRLVAHSMGSRLLMRALPLVHKHNTFSEVVFVCPDVDDGVVKHYLLPCLTTKAKTTMRLYMSHKDEMLKISQLVHGGYKRLGEQTGFAIEPSPYKKQKVDSAALAFDPEAVKRFQTIDFTDMDTGTLGHKIPVSLITNMSLAGRPPETIAIERMCRASEDCSATMLDVASLGESQDPSSVAYFKVKPSHVGAPVLRAVKRKLPQLNTFFGHDWTMK
jgi:hypothetical protein